KPKLPSLASILFLNFPPFRRSFSLLGVCQLGSGVFHRIISLGVFHAFQTSATGAFAIASTVIFVTCPIYFLFVYNPTTFISNKPLKASLWEYLFWLSVFYRSRPNLIGFNAFPSSTTQSYAEKENQGCCINDNLRGEL